METEMKYYGQIEQDESLNNDFRQLHYDLIDKIAEFCKSHNIIIDKFQIVGDGFDESCKAGQWVGYSDSSFACWQISEEYKDAFFRFKISDMKELNRIDEESKIPYMVSY